MKGVLLVFALLASYCSHSQTYLRADAGVGYGISNPSVYTYSETTKNSGGTTGSVSITYGREL